MNGYCLTSYAYSNEFLFYSIVHSDRVCIKQIHHYLPPSLHLSKSFFYSSLNIRKQAMRFIMDVYRGFTPFLFIYLRCNQMREKTINERETKREKDKEEGGWNSFDFLLMMTTGVGWLTSLSISVEHLYLSHLFDSSELIDNSTTNETL